MQEITKIIPQKELSTYKIIIPTKVENMIRVLCSEVDKVEWSGVLFYTYTGSFETKDLTITCQDICVMNIGSGTYTEFIESPIVINYQMDNNLLDCQTGLIHSHNTMATFFSDTDIETLKSEGSSMNNFVSLIVNNAGTYTAVITRLVSLEKNINVKGTYPFFGEDVVQLEPKQYNENTTEIQYFPLFIQKELGENNILLNRIKELKAIKNVQSSIVNIPLLKKEDKTNALSLFEEGYTKYIKLNSKIVETATLQILTGSILITSVNKINLKDWTSKINSVYTRRFKDIKDYEYWIEGHIDAVLQTTEFEQAQYDIDTLIINLAHSIQALIEPYKDNIYINKILNVLNNYTQI
jgi:proteasome lid subunit RPN8/RPN11